MKTLRRAILIPCIAFAMQGCNPTIKPAPVVQTVTTIKYVPIPAELAADCAAPGLTDRTIGGALTYAIALKGALAECTARMQQIRAIQGTAATP